MKRNWVPKGDWLLVRPMKQDERVSESGIILPKDTDADSVDLLECKVIKMSYDPIASQIEKDAMVLIPRLEGMNITIDDNKYKFVKMDSVIAVEIKGEVLC